MFEAQPPTGGAAESFELGEATEFAIRAIVNGVIHPGPALEDYVARAG